MLHVYNCTPCKHVKAFLHDVKQSGVLSMVTDTESYNDIALQAVAVHA